MRTVNGGAATVSAAAGPAPRQTGRMAYRPPGSSSVAATTRSPRSAPRKPAPTRRVKRSECGSTLGKGG
eukprot:scaffold8755_cov99-Isochrysis_galbana.AAC.5